MPHFIVKFEEDLYCEWSTIVDAPLCYGVSRVQAVRYWGEERVARADKNSTSALYREVTLAGLIATNRAGDHEQRMTRAQLVRFLRSG